MTGHCPAGKSSAYDGPCVAMQPRIMLFERLHRALDPELVSSVLVLLPNWPHRGANAPC